MTQSINNNYSSLNAQRNLSRSTGMQQKSINRLSSGYRINSAKDDAAGLAISNSLSSQIRGMNQAIRNANDGISLAQTAEGALGQITGNLQRMRELAVQAANDTYTPQDRKSMQLEIDQIVEEINRISKDTTFNKKNILEGSAGNFSFQVGANPNETIGVELRNAQSSALGSAPGNVQSVSGRVSLENDAVDAGVQGISDNSAGTTLTAGDFTITIAGTTAVDIADATYGGDLTTTATENLKDVNDASYGDGLAKNIAARINTIRERQEADPGSGGTLLGNAYASAKTTFSADDLANATADELTGTDTVSDPNFRYVGAGSIDNDGLTINGVAIGPVAFEEKDADGSLTQAINAKSDTTGVEASINDSGELVLTAEDGRDIVLSTDTSTSANLLFAAGGSDVNSGAGQSATEDFDSALTDLRITGQVTISAQDDIAFGGANITDTGFDGANIVEENKQAVGSIRFADVTTREGAESLIDSADSALAQVDEMRAELGAVQNRFESSIANQYNASNNLNSSRSRIMDSDFAAETANLIKNQIKEKAGIAMQAQAKQISKTLLKLIE